MVYSNSCFGCSLEPETIKIGLSSHKMYSNNIVNLQESTTIVNACTKIVCNIIEFTTYIFIYESVGFIYTSYRDTFSCIGF